MSVSARWSSVLSFIDGIIICHLGYCLMFVDIALETIIFRVLDGTLIAFCFLQNLIALSGNFDCSFEL